MCIRAKSFLSEFANTMRSVESEIDRARVDSCLLTIHRMIGLPEEDHHGGRIGSDVLVGIVHDISGVKIKPNQLRPYIRMAQKRMESPRSIGIADAIDKSLGVVK